MRRNWIIDVLAVLREAAGLRRYTAATLINGIVTAVGIGVVVITGYTLTRLDTVIVGAFVALCLLLGILWPFAVTLWRERHPQIDLSFNPELPWIYEVPLANIPSKMFQSVVRKPARFFSVLAENVSPTQPLHGVHIELAAVAILRRGEFVPIGFSHGLHLQWSHIGEIGSRHKPREFPPLAKYQVDIVSVDAEHNRVWIKSADQWQPDQGVFSEPGTYRLTVAASPLEGARKEIFLCLKWTGQWDQTTMWEESTL